MNVRMHDAARQLAGLVVGALLAVPAALAQPVALVPVASSFTVQIVDLRNGQTFGGIPVSLGPIGAAVDPVAERMYVAHQGDSPTSNKVTVIDTHERRVVAHIPLPSDAWGITVHPATQRAYVAISGSNAVGIIDTATHTLTGTVAVGNTPRDIVVSADGTRVYTANQNGGSFSVVDTTTGTLVGTFAIGPSPLGLALTPDGTELLVATGPSAQLLRIATASNTLIAEVAVESGAAQVALNPAGTRIYISCPADDSVVVLDGQNYTRLARIGIGDTPYGMTVNSDGSRLYTVNVDDANIAVVDTTSNTVLDTIPLPGGAFAVGQWLVAAGLPAAPRITAAVGGNASASVQFTAGFDGGSDLTGFTARCPPAVATLSGPGSPLQFTGLSNNVVHRCEVIASSARGDSPASNTVSVIPGAFGTDTDLSITLSNGATHVIAGTPTTWNLVVQNLGPAAVVGAEVGAPLDAGTFDTVSWSCSSSDGGRCARSSGLGPLLLTTDLPAGSSVQLALTATVAPLPESPVTVLAYVETPAGITDTVPVNNEASDGPDTRGLLRDGFE